MSSKTRSAQVSQSQYGSHFFFLIWREVHCSVYSEAMAKTTGYSHVDINICVEMQVCLYDLTTDIELGS